MTETPIKDNPDSNTVLVLNEDKFHSATITAAEKERARSWNAYFASLPHTPKKWRTAAILGGGKPGPFKDAAGRSYVRLENGEIRRVR